VQSGNSTGAAVVTGAQADGKRRPRSSWRPVPPAEEPTMSPALFHLVHAAAHQTAKRRARRGRS
jgi:hypothetical protein